MKYFQYFLLLLFIGSAKAENSCEVLTPKGSGVFARTRSITTPDGKFITLIGQNHGDRQELRSIMDTVNYKKDSNDLWQWTLQGVLNSNKKAIEDATAEVVYLRKLLKNHPEIKYIGLETDPLTVSDHLKYSKKVQDDLLSEVNRRKISNMKISPLVLGFSGSAVFLKITEPGLMENKAFIGIESLAASKIHTEKLTQYDAARRKLTSQVPIETLEGQDFLKKIADTENDFLTFYPTYISALDEKILEVAMSKTPDKYKEEVKNWISASLDEMKAMKKRDEKMAENLYSKDGSIVATLGLAHLDSVMNLLKEKCKSVSKGTDPKSNNLQKSGVR